MRNCIYLLLAAFFFVSCQESLEDRCARELKQYTKKNCPAPVDEFTTQDSVTYEADTRTIHYYYTLSGLADDKSKLGNARQILIDQLQNTTDLKAYKDKGFNFAYTYRSKSTGDILIEHRLTKEDYK